MTELMHTPGRSQLQQQRAVSSLIQTQSIIIMQTQELEERIDFELVQNPALGLEDYIAVEEELLSSQKEEDHWNEDYDAHMDEYETGFRNNEEAYDIDSLNSALEKIAFERWMDNPERLGKALKAIDDYNATGILLDDMLSNDLIDLEALKCNQKKISKRPDIEVIIDNGNVEARLTHNKGDFLKYKTGMGNHTSKAKLFIEDLQERKRFLQILSDFVFSELQKDFFLEEIYSEALLKLLPVRIPALCDFMNTDVNQLKFLVDNKFVYRTESLVVSCSHGNFPFSAFLPNEPSILQQWILEAQKIGIIKQEEKRKWIIEQFENRINAWDTNDKRRTCTSSLVNITIDDIKYLSKKAKHKA